MKPTSIIFLIVSAVLIIGGLATSAFAKQMAASEGITLVDQISEDGEDKVVTHEYSGFEIGRINVSVRDVDVNIIGGADKPYIELVNFPDGMYEFSCSNRVIEIRSGGDEISFSTVASTITSFKGLRSFVSYFNMSKAEKTINIYLCDSYPVTRIECSSKNGNITVGTNATATDYYLSTEGGNIMLTEINTSSAIDLDVKNGEIKAAGFMSGKLNITADTGSVTLLGYAAYNDIAITVGDLVYDYYRSLGMTNVSLSANVGSVTVDGERFGGIRETSDIDTDKIIKASVGAGDIILNSNASKP